MLHFRKIGDKYIEVCETKFWGEYPRDSHSYTYYSLSGDFKIINSSETQLTKSECDRLVANEKTEPCNHYYKDCVINYWVPTMIIDEAHETESKKIQEKFRTEQDHYLRMQEEHTDITIRWWNTHHSFDERGRIIYGTNDIEIELERQFELLSVQTKIDLLEKYYGINHPYYTEYQKTVMKNHSEYRKSLGIN